MGLPEVEDTRYGFSWGPLLVERMSSDSKGRVVICLRTPKEEVEVLVTPSGLIRLGDRTKTNARFVPFENNPWSTDDGDTETS